MDCLLWVGDHQQDGLLEGESPGLHVAEDHLEGDCRVESGQLEGIPVFFCELQPSSCLSQAVWDLSFWRGGVYGEERDGEGAGGFLELQVGQLWLGQHHNLSAWLLSSSHVGLGGDNGSHVDGHLVS